MIYINIGFPKTSSTNLQSNLYPILPGLRYLGRNYHIKKNKFNSIDGVIFQELNNFVENRKKFSNEDYIRLIQDFKKNYSNEKILISNETWVIPYQKNNITNKMEIVSQFVKLKNLIKFLNDIDQDFKFFIVKRDYNRSIKSLFSTLSFRIGEIFGEEYLDFNFFIDQIRKKEDNYENLVLLVDVFNLKKIKEIIPPEKITIFNYRDILNNEKKFLGDLLNYLDIKNNVDLLNLLKINTRKSRMIDSNYVFYKKRKYLKLFLKFIPKNLKNLINNILPKPLYRFLFLQKTVIILDNEDKLNSIIKDLYN